MRTQNGYPRAVVFGRLEGYEIYADSEKIKPLYFKELKTGRFSRLKKRTAPDTEAGTDTSAQEQTNPSDGTQGSTTQ